MSMLCPCVNHNVRMKSVIEIYVSGRRNRQSSCNFALERVNPGFTSISIISKDLDLHEMILG